jgi:hypothetical protein
MNKSDGVKTSCRLLFSVLLMLLGIEYGFGQTKSACTPAVPAVRIPASAVSRGAEAKLREMFNDDQQDRVELERASFKNWPRVEARDITRRKNVLAMLGKEEILSGTEMYLAAFIFQHGACSEDYLLSNELANAAINRGSRDAKWLYAASMDRYLISKHQPQKFGTQFRMQNGKLELLPFDTSTTDEERRKYNVPPLAEISSGSDEK